MRKTQKIIFLYLDVPGKNVDIDLKSISLNPT